MNVRKVLKVVLVVALVAGLVAGVAYAKESRGRRIRGEMHKEWQHREWRGHSKWSDGRAMRGMGHRINVKRANASEVPQEIREKGAEAKKTAIDLRMELGKNPVDREKALELHTKRQSLIQEVSDWRFTQMLDALTTN